MRNLSNMCDSRRETLYTKYAINNNSTPIVVELTGVKDSRLLRWTTIIDETKEIRFSRSFSQLFRRATRLGTLSHFHRSDIDLDTHAKTRNTSAIVIRIPNVN